MNPHEIIKALEDAGYSLRVVAEALSVSATAVHQTVHRRSRSARIARAVAQATGRSVAELFPDIPEYLSAKPRDTRRATAVERLRAQLATA